MDKCLVTKLANSVSGDFPKLGELIINISTVGVTTRDDSKTFITFSPSSAANAVLTGGLTFYDGSTDVPTSGASAKYFTSGVTGKMIISNKYELTDVRFFASRYCCNFSTPINLSTFKSSNKLVSLSGTLGKFVGDIANLSGKNLNYVRLDKNPDLYGDIVNFVQAFYWAAHNRLDIYSFDLSNNPQITGSIEGLIQAVRALGATESDSEKALNIVGTAVTFNGNPIASATNTNPKVSWTATTITYDGVTINA